MKQGLVALGDSITRGSGEAMLGLRMQSWALWLAEALGLPYTCLARDGARSADVLAEQLPRLRGDYELGCLYVGVNDVRDPGFEFAPFARELRLAAGALHERCERQLIVALPPALGRPPAPARAIAKINSLVCALAEEHGALLMTLETLRGAELVQPDAVHLTARGEAHMALLACRLLALQGARVDDRELVRALAALSAPARVRYLVGSRSCAAARDLRRRTLELVHRRLA